MSYQTISKNLAFVISALFLINFATGCDFVHSNGKNKINQQNKKPFSDEFEKPKVLGTIKSKEIRESSGLVASRCNQGVFWTHNDGNNENHIYAINSQGEKLGTYQVSGAENDDWEDLATIQKDGECFLYIGDIGNNERLRGELTVYKVQEPKVSTQDKLSDKKNPMTTAKAEAIKLSYPNQRHDAETLLVHPETEDIYILSKRLSGASLVYKLSDYKIGQTKTLKEVGKVSVPAIPNGFLTGGEISSDGTRIVICDYYNGYEIVLPKNAENFDEIWKDEPSIIELGKREQGEAICYSVEGEAIYATSEKKDSPFIEVKRVKK